MSYLGIMDKCDTKIDLIKYIQASDIYFVIHLISRKLFDL